MGKFGPRTEGQVRNLPTYRRKTKVAEHYAAAGMNRAYGNPCALCEKLRRACIVLNCHRWQMRDFSWPHPATAVFGELPVSDYHDVRTRILEKTYEALEALVGIGGP